MGWGVYRRFFNLTSIGDAKKIGGSGTSKSDVFCILFPQNKFSKPNFWGTFAYFSKIFFGGGLIVTKNGDFEIPLNFRARQITYNYARITNFK